MRPTGTKEKIVIEGRALLQQHGYNGFSFQDIADKLKIKKPSLYDHFSSKDELIVTILHEYSSRFDQWTLTVATQTPVERVRKVFDVFHFFASDKRKICPVLSLAADFQGLSREIQKELQEFVEKWLAWLESQIAEGQKSKQIRADLSARDLAMFVYSQGMGSQFQARIKNDPGLPLGSAELIVSFLRR